MLSKSIRQDIYNVYGFVRFADEIVDTFHDYNKEELFNRFVEDLELALIDKISLNPILCLKIFVKGDEKKYDELKESAMSLGSAFQKVNFLRDLKADFEDLQRTYFPNTNLNELDENSKQRIIQEIDEDFEKGLEGIHKLPSEAKFGVFMAYRYYYQLLKKLKKTP